MNLTGFFAADAHGILRDRNANAAARPRNDDEFSEWAGRHSGPPMHTCGTSRRAAYYTARKEWQDGLND